MAYNDILTNYKNMLSERLNRLTCLKDLIYEINTDEFGNTIGYSLTGTNAAYNAINIWLPILINESSYPAYDVIPRFITPSSMDTSSTSLNLYIYYTIMSLFIQLEAKPYDTPRSNYPIVMYEDYTERAEDVNYNLINGYADASKSYEDYKSSTQEFYKRAEYWYVRGHLYELLVGANNGDFLERNRYLVEKLCAFLDNEEGLYKASPLKSDVLQSNEDDLPMTRPLTKAEKYWNERIDALRNEINKSLQIIWNDVSYFHTTLVTFVYNYLRLYESTTEYISKGETFISALQKTSTEPNKSLGVSFDKVNVTGLKRYSEGLSKAYEYFVKARQRRDASKYKDDDDNNTYLRKYYQHEVLTDCNFFSKSVEFLNNIKSFRYKLDI